MSKIFEPFFRVDASRTSSTGGVGLGLTIAERAIKLDDGNVRVESANPGLRVWIEIPLSSPLEHAAQAVVKAAQAPVTPAHSG